MNNMGIIFHKQVSGYFHSTILRQALRKGFLNVKKRRERAGLGLPPVAISFFSFSFCFLFSVSSSMMQDDSGGLLLSTIVGFKEKRTLKIHLKLKAVFRTIAESLSVPCAHLQPSSSDTDRFIKHRLIFGMAAAPPPTHTHRHSEWIGFHRSCLFKRINIDNEPGCQCCLK